MVSGSSRYQMYAWWRIAFFFYTMSIFLCSLFHSLNSLVEKCLIQNAAFIKLFLFLLLLLLLFYLWNLSLLALNLIAVLLQVPGFPLLRQKLLHLAPRQAFLKFLNTIVSLMRFSTKILEWGINCHSFYLLFLEWQTSRMKWKVSWKTQKAGID